MMSGDNGPDFSHLPSSDDSSNPKPMDSWSVFGDDACEKPLCAQHVVIDFTPNDDDSDIMQEKVCSFWQFLNNHPEIQNLKVKPEKNLYAGDSNTGIASASSLAKDQTANKTSEKQVIEMLDYAGEKKIVDAALNARLEQCMCPLGSRHYPQKEITTQPKKQEKIKHVCKCIPCRNPNCRNKKASSVPISQMRAVNRMMNKWDASHPKSMEPPGHIPPLQHCLIQRQMFPE